MLYFDRRTRREKWLERAAGILGIVVLTVVIMLAGRNADPDDNQHGPDLPENIR